MYFVGKFYELDQNKVHHNRQLFEKLYIFAHPALLFELIR